MTKQIAVIIFALALTACSPERPSAPLQKIASFTPSPADRESLLVFQKNLLNTENITDRAVKIATDEIKDVITGGKISLNLPAIIDRTTAECLKAGEELATCTISNTLPAELQALLNDGKTGLAASYKAYSESYDAIRRFAADKNPLALLEYRKKYAQAQELYKGSAEKIRQGLTAAGLTAP